MGLIALIIVAYAVFLRFKNLILKEETQAKDKQRKLKNRPPYFIP